MQVIAFASQKGGSGKTTLAGHVAVEAERAGAGRVALVDADMRSPSIHTLFDAKNEDGFSNYLTGTDDLRSLIHETDIPNLWLMTAGRTPPSAAELLSTDRAAEMVAKLLEQFDHVVVDAPPLLGLADAPLISNAIEGVVYVIEARGVPIRGINLSLERLHDSNANLLGAVIPGMEVRTLIVYHYLRYHSFTT